MAAQSLIPMLAYEHGAEAMDWLKRVFGFTETARLIGANGRLSHGELELDGQVVMLAAPDGYRSPNRLRRDWPDAVRWMSQPYIFDGVVVLVDDVDVVLRRAMMQGAEILSALEDGYPGRRFRLADPEGHRWYVIQAPIAPPPSA